ncbi:hypothetical protein DE4381_05215 [Mycobacterium marinum]|nr:hypothetical protein DE4381_05215 [Mycobacterium marinum]
MSPAGFSAGHPGLTEVSPNPPRATPDRRTLRLVNPTRRLGACFFGWFSRQRRSRRHRPFWRHRPTPTPQRPHHPAISRRLAIASPIHSKADHSRQGLPPNVQMEAGRSVSTRILAGPATGTVECKGTYRSFTESIAAIPMTLIQTVFSRDFIIQVSDRRLTKGQPKSKSILIDDENYTKLICWNNSFTAGFTGMSRIDRYAREPTSHWIANVLSDYPLFELGVAALHKAAQQRVQKLPGNWDRRLAIVIAGFDHRQVPLVAAITNFDERTGILRKPLSFRCALGTMVRGHRIGTHVAGQPLNEFQGKLLTRHVRKKLRDNPKVGADALCVFIPRKTQISSGIGGMLMSNLGGPEIPTTTTSFGFFDRRGWRFEQRGPISAGGGMVAEHWASADPDKPDYQSISFRPLKLPPPMSPT